MRNIRIYNMTVADFCANRISKNYTWDNRNVWREIAFYEFKAYFFCILPKSKKC